MTKKLFSLLLSVTLLLTTTACARTVHASDDDGAVIPTAESLPKTDIPKDDTQDSSTPLSQEQSDPTGYPDTLENSTDVTDTQENSSDTTDASTEIVTQRTLDPEKPMVALTFDDGPHATHTDEILDILEENGVVATFFQVGRNLKNDPDAVRRAEAMGCEIGNHSYRHANLGNMSADSIAADLEKADAAFVEVLGHAPNLLRPPYGSMNKAVKSTTERSIITWSIDTEDWRSRNTDKIVATVQGESDLNGQVILMHDVYDTTVEAARILVPWLIEQGYQLVTISELITLHYQDEVLANGLYGYSYFTYGKSVILPEGTTPKPSKPADTGSQSTATQQPAGSASQDSTAQQLTDTSSQNTTTQQPTGSGSQDTTTQQPTDTSSQGTTTPQPTDTGSQGTTTPQPTDTSSQGTTTPQPTDTGSSGATTPPTSSGNSAAAHQPTVQPNPEDTSN